MVLDASPEVIATEFAVVRLRCWCRIDQAAVAKQHQQERERSHDDTLFLSGLAGRRFVDGRAQRTGELERVIVRPEMHEEQSRLLVGLKGSLRFPLSSN